MLTSCLPIMALVLVYPSDLTLKMTTDTRIYKLGNKTSDTGDMVPCFYCCLNCIRLFKKYSMISAPNPKHGAQRLHALKQYKVMDSSHEVEYDV